MCLWRPLGIWHFMCGRLKSQSPPSLSLSFFSRFFSVTPAHKATPSWQKWPSRPQSKDHSPCRLLNKMPPVHFKSRCLSSWGRKLVPAVPSWSGTPGTTSLGLCHLAHARSSCNHDIQANCLSATPAGGRYAPESSAASQTQPAARRCTSMLSCAPEPLYCT